MTRTGTWGAALAAVGFLVAALGAPLALLGYSPTIALTSGDPPLLMPAWSILELAGFTLVTVGVALLLRRVKGNLRTLEKPVLAGLFLLGAGAALRVLFYLLTFAAADTLAQDPTVLDEWSRAWYSAALAAAAGVVFLTASLAPPSTRPVLSVVTGVSAAVFGAIVVLEWDVAGLRDLALVGLAVGLAEVAVQIHRDPVNRFH